MSKKTGKQIRMAVVGVGGMGQGHCKTINKIKEIKLTAICDANAKIARQVGKEHNIPYFTEHTDLINANICDAVLLSTPHPGRHLIGIDLMKAGLHLLSEKPLSETVSTADKMIVAAKKYKVVFAVDFQRRFEPYISKAVEIIRKGTLGKIYRRTMISPEYRSQAYYDSGGWRATWKGEGGGVMMNQAPHVLDIFILLGGMPKTVFGRTETRLHNIEVEDIAETMLIYPDGTTGYFYCSTNEAGPGQMIEIFGDKGKLCWRDGKLKLYKFKPSISEFTKKSKNMWGGPECIEQKLKIKKYKTGHILLIRNFARHILYKEKLVAPGEEGIHSLELANAVWLSAYKKKSVNLPLNRRSYDKFLAKMRKESTFVKKTKKIRNITDPNLKIQ